MFDSENSLIIIFGFPCKGYLEMPFSLSRGDHLLKAPCSRSVL